MTFNIRLMAKTVSLIIALEGLAMLPSIICAAVFGETRVLITFAVVSAFCIAAGAWLYSNMRKYTIKIKTREGYFVVLLCWATVILVGFMPYYFSGCGYSAVNCLFESVASWTTSSAWVLDTSAMPASLLLWKAVSNFLGGIGIVVLAVSVLPVLGVQGQKMASAEVTGPELEKLTARMSDTTRVFCGIYVCLAAVEFLLLVIGRIPVFSAIINTMSTVSTAGIIDYQNSVSGEYSIYIKGVLMVFSILGSMNCVMFVLMARRRFREVARNIELRFFLAVILVAGILCGTVLTFSGTYDNPADAFVNAFEEVVSFGSTSGFTVDTDINAWPSACQLILIIMMTIGGCANSTSGGLKAIRAIVMLKLAGRGVYKRIHPRAMKPVMIRNTPVSAENASSISTFIMLFFCVYLFSCVVFSIENVDMLTTLTAPMALFTNTGTGFGLVSGGCYADFSVFARLYGALLMLAGRLEMYAILIMFSRSFWNSDKVK